MIDRGGKEAVGDFDQDNWPKNVKVDQFWFNQVILGGGL